jgi:DNA-binding Lrp family transcriptional regulator
VQARLSRLEEQGVITAYGPDLDLAAAGFPVLAYVTLEIAQGRLEDVADVLDGVPGVLEAHATTGSGDVLCRVAARSHEDLQATLLALDRSPVVVRSNSVIALSEIVRSRYLPLLAAEEWPGASRSPAFRGRPGSPAT